jgi:hypothetical protein
MRMALAAVGLLVVWSCAANEPATRGQDASPVGDAGDGSLCLGDVQACERADAGVDGDSGSDAEAASAPTCAQTLSVGCTPYQPVLGNTVDFSNCPPTWNDAIAFCIMYAADFGFAQTDCGTYRRWHVENVDVGCSYYYDERTGDLVAVFCTDFMGNTTCLGGPPGFTEPTCPAPDYRFCVPSDALGDGGNRGDAASTD